MAIKNCNIIVQVRDSDNHISMSSYIEYDNETQALSIIEQILPICLTKGILTMEVNEIKNLKINGTKVEVK